MMDEQDQGARIGTGVAVSVALLLAIGLSLWLAMRDGGKKPVAAGAAPSTASAAAADVFVDAPLAGTVIGTLYFAVGDSALPADAGSAIAAIKQAADAAPGKKFILSGFHDPTGDPAKNAELAKNRAKAVRTALQGEGLALERIVLRKPESTTGSGNDQAARRVEVRLVD
jgi:outer membrane protein OmpA-like peptidoglycan-associated protein